MPLNSMQADSIDVEIIDIDIIDGQSWTVMSEADLVELLVVLASKHEQSKSETNMLQLRRQTGRNFGATLRIWCFRNGAGRCDAELISA